MLCVLCYPNNSEESKEELLDVDLKEDDWERSDAHAPLLGGNQWYEILFLFIYFSPFVLHLELYLSINGALFYK